MSSPADPKAPPWLAEFQARFGGALRAPLDSGSGALRADPSRYDAELRRAALAGPRASADERLSVYNRQYWFRLFGVFQSAFPLSSRLLGYWDFNDYVTRFIQARPPAGFVIDAAYAGFPSFFARALRASRPRGGRSRVPLRALMEAIRIDAAWNQVFHARAAPPFGPPTAEPNAMLGWRLVRNSTVEFFREHWPLLELRRALVKDASSAALDLPPAVSAPRWWAFVRRPDGVAQLSLGHREAELFALLTRYSIGEALARLESRCEDAERATLPGLAQQWLARSVALGFWSASA